MSRAMCVMLLIPVSCLAVTVVQNVYYYVSQRSAQHSHWGTKSDSWLFWYVLTSAILWIQYLLHPCVSLGQISQIGYENALASNSSNGTRPGYLPSIHNPNRSMGQSCVKWPVKHGDIVMSDLLSISVSLLRCSGVAPWIELRERVTDCQCENDNLWRNKWWFREVLQTQLTHHFALW